MQVVTRALRQPALDQRGLVRALVVQNQVDLSARREPLRPPCPGTGETPPGEADGDTPPSPGRSSGPRPQTATGFRGERSRGGAARLGRAAKAECDPEPESGSLHRRPGPRARSGGFRYSPTISLTFSINSGSRDNLKVSRRWGCKAKARPIRRRALWLIPQRRAHKRGLQGVASAGVDSRVRVMTLRRRGAPGRGSSSKPSSRRAIKRARHVPPVGEPLRLRRPRRHGTSLGHRPTPGGRAGPEPEPSSVCGSKVSRFLLPRGSASN